jgi:hypothetical protein
MHPLIDVKHVKQARTLQHELNVAYIIRVMGPNQAAAGGASVERKGFAISSVPSVGATNMTAGPRQTWQTEACVKTAHA